MGRKPTPFPKQPQITVAVPRRVLEQLRGLAGARGCSLRYLVLSALPLIGIDVKPEDLREDGRQGRPRGTRRHYAAPTADTASGGEGQDEPAEQG